MSSLYTQLEFSNPAKQIRLLRLEPSPAGTDEYAFSMRVYDFQENSRPSYIAISYTWGSSVPLLPVVINGFRMRVRFNCWYALWQMRHHGHTSNTSFWIDSLCINQGDDEEKGHQVAMMGEIFSFAASVAASLGTGESLGNVREILASRDWNEIVKLRDQFEQFPYFDRVWVKQEIVLAKDICVFYGLERLSWYEFKQVVDKRSSILRTLRFQHGNDDPSRHQMFGSHFVSMQLCNHRSQITNTFTLMDLVVKYETAKASVAADKIYALLSLLPHTDPIRRNLPVTYGEATWFPLFRTLVRLTYSHYQYHNVRDKHSILCMVRDWLGICGLDEDVRAFLESQACHPLDAMSFHQESATFKISCIHVLNDENSGELKPKDLRVEMNQTEPPDAVRKLGLCGHDGSTDHKHSPRCFTTGRDSDGILPKVHIPPQLKSLRTLYNCTSRKLDGILEPARSDRFLVNSGVRPGDLLCTLAWDANGDNTKPQGDLAHVILRRTTFADETGKRSYDAYLEDEAKRCRTALFLHSWAIPVRQEFAMLSMRHSIDPPFLGSGGQMGEPNDTGRLRLHYRDALVPLLLNDHPLQSLLYSRSALNSGAINLSSRVENPENLVERLEEGRDSVDGGGGYMCLCRTRYGGITSRSVIDPNYTRVRYPGLA